MSVYSQGVINDGAIEYHRFDEASGTSAADASGNGNTGTISGAGITYSQAGLLTSDSDTSFLFNGSSGKVTCSVSPVGWSKITLEVLVKLTSNSFAQKATLFATGTTTTNSGDGIKFWIGPNGTNGGFAVGVSGNRWSQATFNQTFTAGVSYLVQGRWDGNTIQLFVNGVKNGTTGSVTGSIDTTGQSLTIGQDPQLGGDWCPATLDEPAVYPASLADAKCQAHYANSLAVVAPSQPQPSFITNPPGNVLLLINDVYYPTIRQETINIGRTANDPIPTFTFALQDDPSHIPLKELSEVVFIDAGQIANPTHNILANPSLNPYTTSWTHGTQAGITLSQTGGGGMTATFANAASGNYAEIVQGTQTGDITPGQTWMFSCYIQGGSSPTNIQAYLQASLLDTFGNQIAGIFSGGPALVSTTLTRYTLQITIPPNIVNVNVQCTAIATNATNSGTITFTQPQFEPMCFTVGNYQLSYPTPWADASQPNCFVLPDGSTIRQLRLFGGVITKATAGAYVGNNRQWSVTVSGYAWLLQKQLLNDSWTAQNDSTIIGGIVSKYFATAFSTGQVATGNQYQNTLAYTYNGTARDAFDALTANSNYLLYIDAYRTIWYQPPGYNTLVFALSDEPDFLTSFPYYNFSRDIDATQLANATYVTGTTGVTWIEFDAQSIAIYNQRTNGQGTFWRSVSDSSIASNAAAQSRAIGETAQYNYARPILHLSTNQFMIPGQTVLVTSSTDGLSLAPYLVQKASLVLQGFQSLFHAVYEFQCDLGAFNPDLTNVLGKVLRRQVANTNIAGAAYYGPIPAPVPGIGVMATEQMNFRDTVQVTVTSTTTIGGIPTTQYGTAAATYGNSLVGYG